MCGGRRCREGGRNAHQGDRAQGDTARHRCARGAQRARLVAARIRVVDWHGQKWEPGTRDPFGAARTLLEITEAGPKAVRRAMKPLILYTQ